MLSGRQLWPGAAIACASTSLTISTHSSCSSVYLATEVGPEPVRMVVNFSVRDMILSFSAAPALEEVLARLARLGGGRDASSLSSASSSTSSSSSACIRPDS